MDDVSHSVDQRFWQRARRHMLGYGGDFVPFVPVRAEGSFLYDASGRRVLDFTSGQMSAILGHSHPEIVATVREAVGTLDHLFSSMLCEPVVALAEALAGLVPDLPRVMLLSTGGEANEAAIRLAKLVTGKWEVVGFAQSWHGMTGGAAAATYKAGRRGDRADDAGQLRHPGAERVSAALRRRGLARGAGRCVRVAGPAVHRQPGGVHRRAGAEQRRRDRPAGRLSGRRWRRIAGRAGMLLILDEAQTGVGRTGLMFAFERDGVVPDILTLSKTLGAGLPLSAVMTSRCDRRRGGGAGVPVLHDARERSAAGRASG